MEQYELIERAVLNCFFTNPKLIETTKLESKHFKKNHRLFNFLKAFYNKYKSFDISLIGSHCDDPGKVIDYIADIMDSTSVASRFPLYERRLIEMYYDYNYAREIYKSAKSLYNHDIDIEQFKNELKFILGE